MTIVPSLPCGVRGLRRAGRAGLRGPGSGRVRCWAGIGLAVIWAAAGIYVLPRLAQAADPGCTAYKGRALAAYNRVITDFGGAEGNSGPASTSRGRGKITLDLPRAINALSAAVARSRSAATARDLARLTMQLRAVLTDTQHGRVVPATALTALNAAAAHADAACGTLRV